MRFLRLINCGLGLALHVDQYYGFQSLPVYFLPDSIAFHRYYKISVLRGIAQRFLP
jgi:hypothetical protein